jgi:nitrate reductase (cytochrome), electron transfer subunit
MKSGELLSWVAALVLVGLLALLIKTALPPPAEAHQRPDQVALKGNRAYDGAPPVIPHQVEELGRTDCLTCHGEGDAALHDTPATITPHPELEACRQCHVTQNDPGVFVVSEFVGTPYPLGSRAHDLAPLLIPHPLTMRENCLGCHGDPAKPEVLQTTHPERESCQQCHVPAFEGWPGPRPNTR